MTKRQRRDERIITARVLYTNDLGLITVTHFLMDFKKKKKKAKVGYKHSSFNNFKPYYQEKYSTNVHTCSHMKCPQ